MLAGPVADRWTRVNQAVAVVDQAGGAMEDAYARLRAHAFVTGQRLPDIVVEVLAGRLMFGD